MDNPLSLSNTSLSAMQEIRDRAAAEELVRHLPLGSSVTFRDVMAVAHLILVAADNAEFDAKRTPQKYLPAREDEGCAPHSWGEWRDDPAGVVRTCISCGELDWRPEG